jgi:ABC-type spermidine/putrescine transport system permease subunit II
MLNQNIGTTKRSAQKRKKSTRMSGAWSAPWLQDLQEAKLAFHVLATSMVLGVIAAYATSILQQRQQQQHITTYMLIVYVQVPTGFSLYAAWHGVLGQVLESAWACMQCLEFWQTLLLFGLLYLGVAVLLSNGVMKSFGFR